MEPHEERNDNRIDHYRADYANSNFMEFLKSIQHLLYGVLAIWLILFIIGRIIPDTAPATGRVVESD